LGEARLVVTLQLAGDGCLAALSAAGHAGKLPAGSNIACAAASALVRTAARLLADAGLVVEAEAPRTAGRVDFRVGPVPDGRRAWLQGTTEFLVRGLRDVALEYPAAVDIRLFEAERERHGTEKGRSGKERP
jgi:uncharacterized protein YsxB (DUF464 family)